MKKETRTSKNKIFGAFSLAILVIFLFGVSVFAFLGNGKNFSFRIGDKDIGFVNRNGLRFDIKKAGTGCCSPFCQEITKEECEGFTWVKEGCGLVSDCDSGCCLPKCEEMPKIQCSEEYGVFPAESFVKKSCNQIRDCEIGCCQFQCVVRDMPKAMCESETTQGKWQKGKCQTGCCELEGGLTYQLPKKTCEECHSGARWRQGECPKGFYVNLKDKVGGQALKDEFLDTFLTTFTGDVIKGEVEVTLEAYTCENTPFSTWKGKLTTKGYATNPKTGTKSFSDSHDITMPFSPDKKSYGFEKLFSAEISERKMKVTLNMLAFEKPIVLEGNLKSGPKECQKKN